MVCNTAIVGKPRTNAINHLNTFENTGFFAQCTILIKLPFSLRKKKKSMEIGLFQFRLSV